MRGLKHYFMCHIDDQTPVASFTDAWIETPSFSIALLMAASHLLQMRGLKHNKEASGNITQMESHLLQMRGLKHNCKGSQPKGIIVASFTDAWIETDDLENLLKANLVASFTDAWIETKIRLIYLDKPVSHLLQMRGLKLFCR